LKFIDIDDDYGGEMRYILGILAIIVLVGCEPYQHRYDRYERDRYDYEDRYDDRDRYERDRYDYEDRYDDRDDPYDRYDLDMSRSILLKLHNDARRNHHRNPLRVDANLENASQRHAEWMAYVEDLSHIDEQGRQAKDRVSRNWRYVGENIAYGYKDEHGVMRAWLDSTEHYKNIVYREHRYVGFGVAKSRNGTTYWCVVFGG
jgi:uncharacterized protein YkwD